MQRLWISRGTFAMPIYEYRCGECGHALDALQKISDEPLKDCPECEQPVLKRLMSAPSFRLKGGGWYETDFKSDKEKKRNLAGAEAASSDSPKSGDKTKTAETAKSADKAPSSEAPKKEKKDKSPTPSGSSSTAAA